MKKLVAFLSMMVALLLLPTTSHSYYAGPTINSFTATPNSITAGEHVTYKWSVTSGPGLTQLYITFDHGIPGNTDILTENGTTGYVLDPFGASTVVATLHAIDSGGTTTATASVTIDDYYASVCALMTTVRCFDFESSFATGYNGDPHWEPRSYNPDTSCCTRATDLAVSGTHSWKTEIEPITGTDLNGSFVMNGSNDGSVSFGEGDEWYLQWRVRMNYAMVHTKFLAGNACNTHLTVSSVTGTFQATEVVEATTDPKARGRFVSYNSGTGEMVIDQVGGRAYVWLAGKTVLGATSGATAHIDSNNGGGLIPSDCPAHDGLYAATFNSGNKLIIISPQDDIVPPTNQLGQMISCMFSHIVVTTDVEGEAPTVYHSCIKYISMYPAVTPNTGKSLSNLRQSGLPCGNRGYNNRTAPYPVGEPWRSDECLLYAPDEWMTFQIHLKVGTWFLYPQPGQPVITAQSSGGGITGLTVLDPGHSYVAGATYTLDRNSMNVSGTSGSAFHATCVANDYGGIPSCTVDNPGSGYGTNSAIKVYFPVNNDTNYHRDTLIEFWMQHPGSPSVLFSSTPDDDMLNSNTTDINYATSLRSTPPWNYLKIWLTNYATGTDIAGGPYPGRIAWADNIIVSRTHIPDPGQTVQPVTNLTRDASSYPSVTLNWERNLNQSGSYGETGYGIYRCPGHMYFCIAGTNYVSTSSWTLVDVVPAGTLSYTETVPNPTQVYTYRVAATDGSIVSALSNPIETAPWPPSDLVASWKSDGSGIDLFWKQGDDHASSEFRVERCGTDSQDCFWRLYKPIGTADNMYAYNDKGASTNAVGGPVTVPFSQIATVAPSSKGDTITYTDEDVISGHHYVYRVSHAGPEGPLLWWQAVRNATTGAAIPRAPLVAGTPSYVTTCPITSSTVGISYSYQLQSTAILPSWSLESGSLPTGLSLNVNGTISGTSSDMAGTYNFSVLVEDLSEGGGPASGNLDCSLVLQDAAPPPGNPPVIGTVCPLVPGVVGVSYSTSIDVSGDSPISLTLVGGSLPPGLSLVSGAISGTPTSPGTATFSLRATNSVSIADLADCQITVSNSEKSRFQGEIRGTIN